MFYARYVNNCYICACFQTQFGGLTSKCAACSMCRGEMGLFEVASQAQANAALNIFEGDQPLPEFCL